MTNTTTTTTTEETFTTQSQYVPQKGDKVYLTEGMGDGRHGLVAEIVGVRELVSGVNRAWFRYTTDEGETIKDSKDIYELDLTLNRKRWAMYFFPVNRCNVAQKDMFWQMTKKRLQDKYAKQQERKRQIENTDRIDAQNAHLLNAAPEWSDIEVVEWAARYKHERERTSTNIPFRRVMKYVQMSRTTYRMKGWDTTRHVTQDVVTLRIGVTRVTGKGWMVTDMPERGALIDFQNQYLSLINAAAAWCVAQNEIERDAINALRRSRGEMVAA